MPRFFARLINRLQRLAQRFGARLPFLAAIIAAIIAALVARFSPINEQSVAGAWILEVNNQAALSCVLDGSGGVSYASNFFNDGGSYAVQSGGDFTMTWQEQGGSSINFVGNFSSDTAGTFTQPANGNLIKVADPAAMSGLWYAQYNRTVGNTETRYGSFEIDSNGMISNASGALSLTSGSMFIANGGVVMHGISGENNAWIEVECTGSGDAQMVTGNLVLDTGYGLDGTFIFQRDPFPQFDESDVAGPWMLKIGGAAQLYAILDGSGVVETASNFFNIGGSYAVDGNGDFTMNLAEQGSSGIDFAGNFSDADTGTFNQPASGTLERIADPSAMAGKWYATWTRNVNADEILSGSFYVNSNGIITSSEGQLPLNTGRIYLSNGGVVMHATTTRNDAWVEVDCHGSGTTQYVSGFMNLDTANNQDGHFVFSRTLSLNNAAVAGAWLLKIGGQAEQYVIFNGSGQLEASNFFGTGGTYNVGGSSLNMQWTQEFGPNIIFSGSFTSAATANLSGGLQLIKVSNPGLLAGTWGGTLTKTTQTYTEQDITFTVDQSGAITSSTGDLSTTSGYAFMENGELVIHATTTETNAWGEFHCWGTGDNSTLSGDMGVDSPYDDDGFFLFTNPPPVNN